MTKYEYMKAWRDKQRLRVHEPLSRRSSLHGKIVVPVGLSAGGDEEIVAAEGALGDGHLVNRRDLRKDVGP